MFSFLGVLYMMGRMVFSAVREHTNPTSKRSLTFIYMCTLFIWTLFPVAWLVRAINPKNVYTSEVMYLFANFTAKVCCCNRACTRVTQPAGFPFPTAIARPAYPSHTSRVSFPLKQVLFSSSIMYGNYMTIAQRRLMAKQEEENQRRVQMVRQADPWSRFQAA